MWYNSFAKVLALVVGVIFLLGLLTVGLLVFSQYRTLQSDSTTTNTLDSNLTVANRIIQPDADDDPYLGDANATLEIISFQDFQCPYCAAGEPIVMQVLEEYDPSEVKFVYRDFPLYTIHAQGLAAANAGECADAQGKFWAWHDLAFTYQADLPLAPEVFSTWAGQVGLDVEEFEQCVADEVYADEVQQDINAGTLAGVSATPTYFVNGQVVRGVLTVQQWTELIETALAK